MLQIPEGKAIEGASLLRDETVDKVLQFEVLDVDLVVVLDLLFGAPGILQGGLAASLPTVQDVYPDAPRDQGLVVTVLVPVVLLKYTEQLVLFGHGP